MNFIGNLKSIQFR
jgi:hypothetical protein